MSAESPSETIPSETIPSEIIPSEIIPSEITAANGQKKNGCGSSCLVYVALLVAIIFASVAGLLIWRLGAAKRAEAMVIAIRDRGEPTTAEELSEYYKVSTGQEDCTKLWMEAISKFDSKNFVTSSKNIPIVSSNDGGPILGESWAEIGKSEALLATYEVEMNKMHEAARKGGAARYPVMFVDGFTERHPCLSNLRVGVRMLLLEANVHAHRGRPSDVVDSIDAISKAGESLANEPLMVSQLVRISMSQIATDTIRTMLPRVDFSDDDLKRLKEIVSSVDSRGQVRCGLMGERVFGLTATSAPERLGQRGSTMSVLPEDLMLYLDAMEKFIKTSEQPLPQAIIESQRISGDTVAEIQRFRIMYLMTSMMLPATDRFVLASGRSDIDRVSTATLIAIEQYRRKRGELPKQLQQLVPEFMDSVPIDPFAGMPLRYVADDKEIRVYSIGRDGVDDGGVESKEAGDPDDVSAMELVGE
ncbi:MAG: hypothetical protein ACI9G1_001878 [Pirellulaceae bacterium]|jgi:hypothetical protein